MFTIAIALSISIILTSCSGNWYKPDNPYKVRDDVVDGIYIETDDNNADAYSVDDHEKPSIETIGQYLQDNGIEGIKFDSKKDILQLDLEEGIYYILNASNSFDIILTDSVNRRSYKDALVTFDVSQEDVLQSCYMQLVEYFPSIIIKEKNEWLNDLFMPSFTQVISDKIEYSIDDKNAMLVLNYNDKKLYMLRSSYDLVILFYNQDPTQSGDINYIAAYSLFTDMRVVGNDVNNYFGLLDVS